MSNTHFDGNINLLDGNIYSTYTCDQSNINLPGILEPPAVLQHPCIYPPHRPVKLESSKKCSPGDKQASSFHISDQNSYTIGSYNHNYTDNLLMDENSSCTTDQNGICQLDGISLAMTLKLTVNVSFPTILMLLLDIDILQRKPTNLLVYLAEKQ